MNIVSIGILAVTASILALSIRRTNPEMSLLLICAAAFVTLAAVIGCASGVISTVNEIVASTQLNVNYISVLFKAIGICLVTEFTANVCRDSGSSSLAGTVNLAGKLLVTFSALPLYIEIFNTAVSLLRR